MTKQIHVEKRYMCLPVSRTAQVKKLILSEDGRPVVELDLRLAARPDLTMPYDMAAFVGKTLTLETSPQVDFEPAFADQPDDAGLYSEKYRPVCHFTAPRGWINDPNGLYCWQGQYHMFYQHNPVDTIWGNMHWGHAVSDDLLTWRDRGEALCPDATGTMFSGSAVVDERNVTGLGTAENPPILLYYTAAGGSGRMSEGEPFTQRLAYSIDGGATFAKYPEPMVRHIAESNRDPKVIYCDELGAWLMALYLRGREFMLLRSDDLLKWTPLQRLALEDDDECPDFFPLEEGGERWWVFSAAHSNYLVGRFAGGLFTPVQSPRRLHWGEWYAAQTFSGMAPQERVRIAWNRAPVPDDMPFQSSMSTPMTLTLRRDESGLALCARPIEAINALWGDAAEGADMIRLPGRANDIDVTLPKGGKRTLSLFGLSMALDTDADTLSAGGVTMPLNGSRRIRIIQDVHAVEVYSEHGDSTMCVGHAADEMLDSIACPGAAFTARALRSVHI